MVSASEILMDCRRVPIRYTNELENGRSVVRPTFRSVVQKDLNELFSLEYHTGLVCTLPLLADAALDIFLKLKFERLWLPLLSDLHGFRSGNGLGPLSGVQLASAGATCSKRPAGGT